MEQEEWQGHTVRRLWEVEQDPPITAAHKAMGSLWFGEERPTVIFSSAEAAKKMLFLFVAQTIKPEFYHKAGRRSFGFNFNGAIWTEHDCCGSFIYLLNENHPEDPRMNGYYLPKE